MKRSVATLLLLGVFVLSACTVQVQPPTPEPVTAPAATTPAAPESGAAEDGARVTRAVELTTNPWQWVSFSDPKQTFDLESPEDYTIAFNPDGTVNVKADCNTAIGSYTADDTGSLTIELGPLTAAACPPESRSDEFVERLGFVVGFFFENGSLYLDTFADSGTFRLAAAPESAAAARTFGDAWESVVCETFEIAPEVAAQADCGYVTVPENRATGSEQTIRLAVVRVRSTGDNPGAPVVRGTGGPGGVGFGRAIPSFLQTEADILADRDYVFFAQRGTEFSEPYLGCTPYDLVPFNAAMNNWPDEEATAQKIATLQDCYDAFVAEGVDFSAYNTNENAADINDIRQTLGHEKIIYLGESYGTMLGQFLMRNHPDILEAVILDGIAPVSAQHWSDVTSMPGAFQRVFAVCAADEVCSAAYPDPEGAMAEAFAALEANPQPVELTIGGQTGTVMVDGTLMMNALFLNLYVAGGYAQLPAIAYQMQANELTYLYSVLPLFLNPSGTARVMHLAIVCSDDPVGSLDDVNVENMAEMYVALAYDDARGYVNGCPILNLEQFPAISDEPVSSDLPVLLLNGGLDPATPAEPARALEATLPNSQYVVFPDGTHIQHNGPCGTAILDAFMTDPLAKVDESCIPQQFTFVVPRRNSVRSEDGSVTLSMEMPDASAVSPTPWLRAYGNTSMQILPPDTTPEEAISTFVKTLPITLEMEFVDADPIAGYPTTLMRADSTFQGSHVGVDSFAFQNEAGTYVVTFITTTAALIESFRENNIPELLASVMVEE